MGLQGALTSVVPQGLMEQLPSQMQLATRPAGKRALEGLERTINTLTKGGTFDLR